jgi:hypothetical protein
MISVDTALDDHIPQTRHRIDDHLGARTGDRVGGEQHPGGERVDHPLHQHAHPHRAIGETGRLPVGERARTRQRRPAPPHGLEQRLGAADVQHRLVLAGEAGLRQVLDRGARSHRDRARPEPLVARDDLPTKIVGEQPG